MSKATQLEHMGVEMLVMLNAMERVLRGTDAQAQAQAYWISHIRTALTGEGTMSPSLRSTITALREEN
jgi:hypothetical protein